MADSVPGPSLVSMAQQFTGLPMTSLIGAPLMAAAKANQQMALTQVDFLMSTCFYPVGKDGKPVTPVDGNDDNISGYRAVMIDMSLVRGVLTPDPKGTGTTIQNITSTISLPILTILPLNSLAVDNVNVNFVMEVKSSFSNDTSVTDTTNSKAKASFQSKLDLGLFTITVHGSVSTQSSHTSTNDTHYKKSNSATYTVDVHAGQLPLPEGVTTIIQAYAQNLSPIEMPIPVPPAP